MWQCELCRGLKRNDSWPGGNAVRRKINSMRSAEALRTIPSVGTQAMGPPQRRFHSPNNLGSQSEMVGRYVTSISTTNITP
jgi:hypothetical protein